MSNSRRVSATNRREEKPDDQDGASDHDPEGEERDCDRRTLVSREIFAALHLAVEIVSKDEASEQRHLDGESVVLPLFVGNGERKVATQRSISERASMAANSAG